MNHVYRQQTSRMVNGWLTRLLLLVFITQLSSLWSSKAIGQTSGCTTPGILAQWNFNSQAVQCNGASPNSRYPYSNITPDFQDDATFCPQINAGCGQAVLGSKGHQNTLNFAAAVCLLNFYDPILAVNTYGGVPFDVNATVFDPEQKANLYINYIIPVGKASCLTSFGISIIEPQGTTPYFEKQGVAVYRNGVLIYNQTQTINASNVNGTPLNFAFTGNQFCSDGSAEVKFEIVFGLVHQLANGPIGYDDITINGICGGGPNVNASVTPATCGTNGPLANASITLTNFSASNKYDYTLGATYTGTKTYATATSIPTLPNFGVIANNLPNPISPQQYTVRVFDASGCFTDNTVTLTPSSCPTLCIHPSTITLTPTPAPCSGNNVSGQAQIAVTGVTGGDKVGISAGSTYTGSYYADANTKPLTGGAYTFTNLGNPSNQVFTIRVFNGSDACYTDQTVTVLETVCGPCQYACAEICESDALDPDSSPSNSNSGEDDMACYSVCTSPNQIDLELTKTVNPASGATCPTGTTFTWILTLQNKGTMTATNINVADLLPAELMLVSSTPSVGTFYLNAGWSLPSLAANQSATLTLTTKALLAGTFTNYAYVNAAFPDNDIDSSPNNDYTANEDDDASASITVTGPNPPTITKGFSPIMTKPNTPTRLTLKITNNETTAITLTAPFVDNLPSSPGQMVIAATPNLNTTLAGVVATAGGTSITIPTGTVLAPGLNQIELDITVPSAGQYCNDIAAGDLKTSSCDNVQPTQACLTANDAFVMAPLIKKAFSPQIVQANQNSTLTITVENRNSHTLTLLQAFNDYLPSGLVIAGSPSSSCGTVTGPVGGTVITLASGSVLQPGSCTITIPVRSATNGTYCNLIPMNAMITQGGGKTNIGNQDVAEACLTVGSTPCTTLSSLSISPAISGETIPANPVSLTVTGTGTGPQTQYAWSVSPAGGSFSSQTASTTFTPPTVPGTYTITATLNNNATGTGSCTAVATATYTLISACSVSASVSTTHPTCLSCGGSTGVYSVVFNSYPQGGSYQFSPGSPFNAATATPKTAIPASGSVAASAGSVAVVRIYDANGCYQDYPVSWAIADCFTVPIRKPGITVSVPTCVNGSLSGIYSIAINNNNNNQPVTYQYSTGTSFNAATAQPVPAGTVLAAGQSLFIMTPGTYTLRLQDGNGGSCYSKDTTLTITPVACTFDLALRKTLAAGQSANVTPGSSVTFTVTVFNQGDVDATAIQVTDYIPTGLTLADANWTASAGKATLNTPIASLAAGQSTTRNIVFTVGAGVTGSITNTAEISSATGGTDKDSTPDGDPTNDGTPQNDVITGDHKGNPNDDEDDSDPEPITVTIACAAPTPTGTPAARCGTGTVTLTASGCDATYPAVWFSDAALTTQVGTGNSFTTPAIAATTTYYVACVKDATCKSAGVSVVATVNPAPALSVSNVACAPNLQTYSLSFTSDGSVTSTAGTVSGNTVTGIPVGTNVTLVATLNGCTTVVPVTAPNCACPTINPPTGSSSVSICAGATIPALTVTVGAGLQANWYSAATGGTLLQANSLSYTPSAAGTVYVEAVDAQGTCKSATRTPITLTINPAPGLTLGTISCAANGLTYSVAFTSNGTVTASLGSVSGNTVTGIPSGQTVTLTASLNGCTSSTTASQTCTAPIFDLALRKTLAAGQSANVTPGSSVTFTVTVFNQGNVAATAIQVSDYIPTGLTLNDANWTASAGKATLNTPIASLAAGQSTTRNIVFTVGAGATGTITNTAEISSATGGTDKDSTPDGDPTNDGTPQNDVITGDHKGNPSDDEDDSDPEPITVTIACAAPTPTGTPAARCGTGTVTLTASGCNATYPAIWFSDAALTTQVGTGNSFTTPAIAATTTYYVACVKDAACKSAGVSVVATVNPAPALTVSNVACAANLQSYSLSFASTGTVTSTAGTVSGNTVTGIPAGTSITLTATLNGCTTVMPVTAPNCACPTINPPTGSSSVSICAGATIPALTVTVGAGLQANWYSAATGGTLLQGNSLSYTPLAAGTVYVEAVDAQGTCKSATRTPITLTINPAPGLTLGTISCAANGLTYSVAFTSNGTVTASLGSVSGNTVTGIPSGQTVTLTASLNGCTSSTTASQTCTAPIFDLALRKTLAAGQSANVTPGSSVTFTVTVFNQGNVAATAIQVSDYIPTGLTLNDANWTASAGKATLNTPIASLAAGQSTTRNIVFTVGAGVTGSITNTAEISSATGGTDIDSNPDNDPTNDGTPQNDVITGDHKGNPNDDEDDSDPEVITVSPTPVFDLALRKTLAAGQSANVTPGSSVTFTVTVFNQGNINATAIQVTDYIPTGLTLADANWTASAGKATLNTPIASLAAGQSTTRNIVFTVGNSFTGTITNTAEISSSTGGTDIDSNPDDDPTNDGTPQNDVITGDHKGNPNDDEDDSDPEVITVGPVQNPVLSLTKSVSKSRATLGEVVSYTVTLTNSGNGPATNVVVQDSVSAGLLPIAGSATASTGTFTIGSPFSNWTIASLPAGATATLVFSASITAEGIQYNKATIPGDTATACTSVPMRVCSDDVYTFRLTAPAGRSSYKWFKDGVEIAGQTSNTLDVTAPGTYSLATDANSGQCPDFSCCPFIVEEVATPTFSATATPVTCQAGTPKVDGRIVLSQFAAGLTYQYSSGTTFNPGASLSGAAQAIPANGVIASNLANPVGASQAYTVRVFNATGCYTDVVVTLSHNVCVCPPQACTPVVIRQTKGPKRNGL